MGYKHLLLVEGKNDLHVVGHLLNHHGIDCELFRSNPVPKLDTIFIREMQGLTKLLEALPILVEDGDLKGLGIVVDADTDLGARWVSISQRLKSCGSLHLPDEPNISGTTGKLSMTRHEVTIGIWLMPNNQLPGALENFVQFLVPVGDDLLARSRNCIKQIPENMRQFPPGKLSKAEVYTWLAWQEEPGKPLGQAITSRYLDANAPYALQFVHWIRDLFGIVTHISS